MNKYKRDERYEQIDIPAVNVAPEDRQGDYKPDVKDVSMLYEDKDE